jgi:hypothetical protein
MGVEAGVVGGFPLWVVDPLGFATVTVSTTPVSLPVSDLADDAVVQVQGASVSMRLDGLDPTPTVGHELVPGDVVRLAGLPTLRIARFVRRGAADATLAVHFGRLDRVALGDLVRRGALSADGALPPEG